MKQVCNEETSGNNYNKVMKAQTILRLTVLLILISCGPAPLPTPTETVAATKEPTRTPAPSTDTPRPTASPTPRSNRTAVFGMVENTVDARKSKAEGYAPASLGLIFPVGGQARTGDNGRARLNLRLMKPSYVSRRTHFLPFHCLKKKRAIHLPCLNYSLGRSILFCRAENYR